MIKVLTCPLGHKCEEIKNNELHICNWLVDVKGKNPQTGELVDERSCAITWLPILTIESNNTNRSVHDAIVSMREETIKRQDLALQLKAVEQLKLVN